MKSTINLIIVIAFTVSGCLTARKESTATGINKSVISLNNPVFDQNFPDPTVIKAAGKYYAYATQSTVNEKALNIQVASSADLQHWTLEGDALPVKPSWANNSFWAPHVLYDSFMKKYVMFYSGETPEENIGKCIGVAFADKPTGPFTDKGTPLVCGAGFINIDPMAFADPETGKKALYWGSDFQPLKVQELSDDWSSFKPGTSPKPIIFPGKDKDYSQLIEASWIDYNDGKYYLYYSGDNCCGSQANYAVMVAKADNIFGPFERYSERNGTGSSAILIKDSAWSAPGHNSVFTDDNGNKYIAYHAISRRHLKQESEAEKGHRRVMCISPLTYKNGWPQTVAIKGSE